MSFIVTGTLLTFLRLKIEGTIILENFLHVWGCYFQQGLPGNQPCLKDRKDYKSQKYRNQIETGYKPGKKNSLFIRIYLVSIRSQIHIFGITPILSGSYPRKRIKKYIVQIFFWFYPVYI